MRVVALVASLVFTSVLGLPKEARADEVDTCANAFEAAQRLHKKDDPKAISEASTCARDVCPDVLRKECSVWVKEWTPAAKAEPAPKSEAKEPAPKSEAKEPAAKPAETAEPASDTSRPVPVLTYVLGAGGLVTIGVAGVFALHGVSIRNELAASGCEPNCSSSRVDEAKRSFLIADVVGITGALALGGALAIFLTRPEVKEDAKSKSRSRVAVSPAFGGAFVHGTF